VATSTDDLRERKARLRKEARARRDAIPAPERARLSRLVTDRLLAVIEPFAPHTVMLFASFGSEIDTRGMIETLDRAGRRIALPVVGAHGLRAVPYRPGDPVRTARFGAEEPQAAAELPPEDIDVVVVPGLAFDRQGYRVGYGRGYYDRFLARTRADARRVGIAFAVQTVSAVPHGPSDWPVDCLVTETETVCCRRERAGILPGPDH
jgi:5-formyltetrahydrofolate cyclo-ligase